MSEFTIDGVRGNYVVAILAIAWLTVSCVSERGETNATPAEIDHRPNILLIMADDLGYTDLGVFGSEIRTPNIDLLAKTGVSFRQFYAAPTCSPSRATVMTGVDNHLNGFGNMGEHLAENQRGKPGYEGFLNGRVVTFPTLLRGAGYHTYMAGKWHIGSAEQSRPENRGFERSFALMQAGASHFSDKARLVSIYKETVYREDGVIVEALPKDFYSSEYFADKTIDYIDSNLADGRPFFAWLAFTAPHWPVQVKDEHLDLYAGAYDAGYDEVREQRLLQSSKIGFVPSEMDSVVRVPTAQPWDSLTVDEQQQSIRSMEIYAAMVERMDFQAGRVIQYLKDSGVYENTVVIFMSDNGAEGNDRMRAYDNRTWVPRNFDVSYENIGKRGSYAMQGPGWGQVSSGPLRFFKGYVTEGGLRVPFIVRAKNTVQPGRTTDALATARDIAPTILGWAGIAARDIEISGYQKQNHQRTGKSLSGVLNGNAEIIHSAKTDFGWELFGHKALRRGDWKILWADGRNGSNDWQLFNISDDARETVDLRNQFPDKFDELMLGWEAYAKENNVIEPTGDIGQVH